MSAPSMTSQANASSFRLERFARPYATRLTFVFSVLVVNAALGLANPWLVQNLVDDVLLARRPEHLWVFAAVFAGLALLRFLVGIVQGQTYAATSALLLLDLRTDFLAHVQRASLSWFAGARYGDLVVRFNRDLAQVQEFITATVPMLVTNALTVIGVVACGLAYDPELFLLASLPFPIALLLARLFRGRIERLTRTMREQSSELASGVNESLTGMRAARSFGREKRELLLLRQRGHRLVRSGLAFQLANAWAGGLPRLCLVASTVIVYSIGGARVIRGEIPLGTLIALSMYVGMMFAPLLALAEGYLTWVGTRVSIERVREMRDRAPEVVEPEDAPRPAPIVGRIVFEAVHFRYEEDRPILDGVSFAIKPGETVALIGPSGVGKSTIVDLLFRFLDPRTGRVLVDGQDLRAIRTRDVRSAMAVVSQDVFLFHASIRENVRYGRAGATDAEVESVASAAGIDAMFAPGTSALETIVGERGARLSGGQRQRIAIARALLREPRILVLDEATSSLDYASDRAIRAGIERLSANATTIIVTHRLSSVLDVDRVFVLEDGHIVGEGPPGELARSEKFRGLFVAR